MRSNIIESLEDRQLFSAAFPNVQVSGFTFPNLPAGGSRDANLLVPAVQAVSDAGYRDGWNGYSFDQSISFGDDCRALGGVQQRPTATTDAPAAVADAQTGDGKLLGNVLTAATRSLDGVHEATMEWIIL